MLWNDTRSAPEARALIEALDGPAVWAERIGSVPVASLTVTKWAWLRRHEPGPRIGRGPSGCPTTS
jgi:xylulokinase